MNSRKTFAVGGIGVPTHEQRVLRNIFKLSNYRSQSYLLADIDDAQSVSILIVNAEDTNALQEWRAFRSKGMQQSSLPTVMISDKEVEPNQPYCIRRPFVATRVLSVLDQVVLKELKYEPSREIGNEANPPVALAAIPSAPASDPSPMVSPVANTPAPEQAAEAAFSYSALVVDDSRPIRKQIQLELELFGVRADLAETGEEAFALLDRNSYDLIFLDVVLPGVDGYKVCRTIKKDKLKKDTPVIMLTSKSSPFDRIRGSFAGCDTYLTKPVPHDSFHKVIKKYLSGS